MNQIETISYLSNQLVKVTASHGADSDHTASAFYKLQAARMGLTGGEIYKWAESEMERLKSIALESASLSKLVDG